MVGQGHVVRSVHGKGPVRLRGTGLVRGKVAGDMATAMEIATVTGAAMIEEAAVEIATVTVIAELEMTVVEDMIETRMVATATGTWTRSTGVAEKIASIGRHDRDQDGGYGYRDLDQ